MGSVEFSILDLSPYRELKTPHQHQTIDLISTLFLKIPIGAILNLQEQPFNITAPLRQQVLCHGLFDCPLLSLTQSLSNTYVHVVRKCVCACVYNMSATTRGNSVVIVRQWRITFTP